MTKVKMESLALVLMLWAATTLSSAATLYDASSVTPDPISGWGHNLGGSIGPNTGLFSNALGEPAWEVSDFSGSSGPNYTTNTAFLINDYEVNGWTSDLRLAINPGGTAMNIWFAEENATIGRRYLISLRQTGDLAHVVLLMETTGPTIPLDGSIPGLPVVQTGEFFDLTIMRQPGVIPATASVFVNGFNITDTWSGRSRTTGQVVQGNITWGSGSSGGQGQAYYSKLDFNLGVTGSPSVAISQDPIVLSTGVDSFSGVIGTVSDPDTTTSTLALSIAGNVVPDVAAIVDSVDPVTGEVSVTINTSTTLRFNYPMALFATDLSTTALGVFTVIVDDGAQFPVADSTLWPFHYEANGVYPVNEPDLPTTQTWTELASHQTNSTTSTDHLNFTFPLASGHNFRDALNGDNWRTHINNDTPYSVETRLRVDNSYGGGANLIGWVLWTSADGFNNTAYLNIHDNATYWGNGGGIIQLDTELNNDDFHTFLVNYDPVFDAFDVYRDGVLIGNNLADSGITDQDWILMGDTSSSAQIDGALDYVRWTTGTFSLNQPPIVNLTSNVSVDIGTTTSAVNLGSVSDNEDDDNTLTVQVVSGLTTGVTMSLSSSGGSILADVSVAAGTSPQILNVTIEVTDSHGATTQDTIELLVGGVDPLATQAPWAILE